ncbi:20904_t:CDS:2, partial [Dentiscutata erythropus]
TQSESDNEEIKDSDSSTSEGDKIPSSGLCRYWQYTHRQFRQKMQLTKRKGRKKAANTTGLLKKVRAAIFLSLDELWSAQSEWFKLLQYLILDLKILNRIIW